jgi:hypothetical protein
MDKKIYFPLGTASREDHTKLCRKIENLERTLAGMVAVHQLTLTSILEHNGTMRARLRDGVEGIISLWSNQSAPDQAMSFEAMSLAAQATLDTLDAIDNARPAWGSHDGG